MTHALSVLLESMAWVGALLVLFMAGCTVAEALIRIIRRIR